MTPDEATRPSPDPRRWKALAVLGLVQFMLILDVTVVNIALPTIRTDLGFTPSGLTWVVNAYVLVAGGFLLLGGRLADLLGRKRTFLIGLLVFASASAGCGAATSPTMLVTARFVQGAGEALATPASLGMVAVLFALPAERAKALGIWGAIAGLGGTFGTVISGVVVDLVSWRWIFLINLPIAAIALIALPRLVKESRAGGPVGRPDVFGAIAGTVGFVAIVDGLLARSSHSWGSIQVVGPLLVGVGSLSLMIMIETIVESPLIPRSFFHNRTRVVSNVSALFFSASFFAYFFALTLFEQQVLRWSPLAGGVSYLPFGVTIGLGTFFAANRISTLGARHLLGVGFLGCATGLMLTSTVRPGASYLVQIVPGMMVLGFCAGICFPVFAHASLTATTAENSSLAAGVQNAMQRVGGALGLATLVTLGLQYSARRLELDVPSAIAATDGFVLIFRISSLFCLLGAAVVLIAMRPRRAQDPRSNDPIDKPGNSC